MTKTIIIEGKETTYTISENGDVYNTKTKRFLKGTTKRNDYRSVQLTVNGTPKTLMIHRLVAEAFLPSPENLPIVHHKDGDKLNNNVENLQWVTSEENNLERFEKNAPTTKIDTEGAEWKPLIGFEDEYAISNNGAVKNAKNQRILSGTLRNGYRRYNLNGKNYSAHRLVYETFVGPIPEGMVIDHINGDRDDNRVENLRCITQSENMNNAHANGHKGQHKVAQYDLDNNLIKEYPSYTAAAKELGVTYGAISSAAKRGGTSCGYIWKEL